jgi:hypothetical protein
MTVDNFGNLVLDSQADSILLFVSNPGTPAQSVSELPLTDAGGNPVLVDDTDFPSTSSGTIYFTDSGTNTIYALESDSFDINVGYSSSGPSIGTVDLSTGLYTPIVTGLNSSHGATFVSAAGPDFQNDCSGDDGEAGGVGAAVSDFNGDGHPDYVLQNASTRQTAIWYLNNNFYIGGAYGPTLVAGWGLRGVSDFIGDSHSDYALFAPSTNQTGLWYLSGPTFIGGAFGPTLPSGWELVGTADFNGDNKPDYVLYNASTRQTAIWYLNNNVFVSGAYGPTLPFGWSLIGQ